MLLYVFHTVRVGRSLYYYYYYHYSHHTNNNKGRGGIR